MRALTARLPIRFACLSYLLISFASAEEKADPKDFELQFLENNKVVLRGVLRPSAEIVKNLIKEKYLLKSAKELQEKGLLKDESYECEEIKNDDKLVGLKFVLHLNEKVDVGMLGKLIDGLPKDALANLPKEYRDKVESALQILKVASGSVKLNGAITITSLLPESGRTSRKDAAEIQIAVELTYK